MESDHLFRQTCLFINIYIQSDIAGWRIRKRDLGLEGNVLNPLSYAPLVLSDTRHICRHEFYIPLHCNHDFGWDTTIFISHIPLNYQPFDQMI